MKNLAGHPVSIFLFRFVLRNNGISYVVNESIAEDMYPEIDEQIQPLVHACSETLLRYRQYCNGKRIMDGNILEDGFFEVMLSPGLGRYIPDAEKQNLFKDAHRISELLEDVMDRRSKEIEQGQYPGPQPIINRVGPAGGKNAGYEKLGIEKSKNDDKSFPNKRLLRMSPQDLPQGVVANLGYDHRGKCYVFEHETLGGLGKITLVPQSGNRTKMEAELFIDSRTTLDKRKELFEQVVQIISTHLSLAKL